ncbi:hypothetical protein BDM02DRAFT_3122098 [Thelephora ganbajun]|uniref:Uncharacterized protein n=1 Tax=Thelephora ganbajun TaxID=370292 RepID=A0ACB6Z3R6_THEGA|nr:hypothetical protein BDM02DRAFT_3122098 [Thelephora ganbajun]
MFQLRQPSSATSNVDTIDVIGPPRALEVILCFIYPSTDPPTINNLTLLSQVLVLADKYDIGVARSRSQTSLVRFARTEPLRVYAIACRLGFEDEMRIASLRTTLIHLLGLAELPDEFKLIPATEYHRLILLHVRYRKEAKAIATTPSQTPASIKGSFFGVNLGAVIGETMRRPVVESIRGGTPLNYESLVLAVKTDHNIDAETSGVGKLIRSILDKANALDLTV